MYLEHLITALENEPSDKKVSFGFKHPHSYRGSYEELAFEPCNNTTVGEMLKCAKEALGTTYEGYKGGSYKMEDYTQCNLAYYGESGESLSGYLLGFMLGYTPSAIEG